MWPNIRLSDSLAIVFEGSMFNQNLRTTFYYELTAMTGDPPPINNAVANFYLDAQWINLRQTFLACCPVEYTLNRTSFQYLKDPNERYMKIYETHAGLAGLGGSATSANTQASITRRGIQARRQFVGGIRVPWAIPASNASGGKISQGGKDQLSILADLMDDSITCSSGGADQQTWQPVMLRVGPGGEWYTSPIVQTRVMDEVRTLRRRTVGHGE